MKKANLAEIVLFFYSYVTTHQHLADEWFSIKVPERTLDVFHTNLEPVINNTYVYVKKWLEYGIFSEIRYLKRMGSDMSSNAHLPLDKRTKLNLIALGYSPADYKKYKPLFNFSSGDLSRGDSNKVMRAVFDSTVEAVEFAKRGFALPWIDHCYGGRGWYNACVGWELLNEASSLSEKIVAIDHVFDIQHNNGYVLDKHPEVRSKRHLLIDFLTDKSSTAHQNFPDIYAFFLDRCPKTYTDFNQCSVHPLLSPIRVIRNKAVVDAFYKQQIA